MLLKFTENKTVHLQLREKAIRTSFLLSPHTAAFGSEERGELFYDAASI
jgi:hypothetical protein